MAPQISGSDVNGANTGHKPEISDATQSVGGYLVKTSASFDKGVQAMNRKLDATLAKLTKDPSNPELLARYQSLLSEYTLYRNLQSNVIKTLKDVDNNIISNFR